MRVLIADDDEIALLVLQEALKKAGYDVITARNGREVLEHVRQGNCRLVVSDWEMPEMPGVGLCKVIRAEQIRGNVTIILLTGHDTPEERVEGFRAGAD